jgi:hypothetical protein
MRIPLAINPPPIITPRDMAPGCTITDAVTRGTAQIMAPIIQRQSPIIIFKFRSALGIGQTLTAQSLMDCLALLVISTE